MPTYLRTSTDYPGQHTAVVVSNLEDPFTAGSQPGLLPTDSSFNTFDTSDAMPPWRLHPGADFAMPRDHYDGNSFVAPHFSYTPELMPVSVVYESYGVEEQVSKWRPIAREIGRQARALYRTYGLQACSTTKAGLYLAGNNEEMKDLDRDRMMILVLELEGTDCHRWQEVDEDARALLKDLDTLCHRDSGICLRYYVRERQAPPGSRNETRSADPVRDNEPPSSPLHDPYGQDHPSIRRMARAQLPPNTMRHRPEVVRPPTVRTGSRAEFARQRMYERYQSNAQLFRTDSHSNDPPAPPPYSESNQVAVGEEPRREEEEEEEEEEKADEAGPETEPETESAALIRRYSRLAQRIDREHEYNIDVQLSDYRLYTRYLNIPTTDWGDDATTRDDDSDRWSYDGSDDQLLHQGDAEGDDERLQVRQLPRIDRGDLPAARNRAVQYLRQMTTADHDRHFGGRSV